MLYIDTSTSKILVAGFELGYTSWLYIIRPSRPHYEFMILFDFRAPSVNSFNRKQCHVGIRIFIRIIYYLINGYPDSNLFVLSISNYRWDTPPKWCIGIGVFMWRAGTLRPDLIESASELASGTADTIKTHHNDTELVRQLRQQVIYTPYLLCHCVGNTWHLIPHLLTSSFIYIQFPLYDTRFSFCIFVTVKCPDNDNNTLCSEKKHLLTFSFISPWIICGFKQKLQWIYPRIGRFWQCKN